LLLFTYFFFITHFDITLMSVAMVSDGVTIAPDQAMQEALGSWGIFLPETVHCFATFYFWCDRSFASSIFNR